MISRALEEKTHGFGEVLGGELTGNQWFSLIFSRFLKGINHQMENFHLFFRYFL